MHDDTKLCWCCDPLLQNKGSFSKDFGTIISAAVQNHESVVTPDSTLQSNLYWNTNCTGNNIELANIPLPHLQSAFAAYSLGLEPCSKPDSLSLTWQLDSNEKLISIKHSIQKNTSTLRYNAGKHAKLDALLETKFYSNNSIPCCNFRQFSYHQIHLARLLSKTITQRFALSHPDFRIVVALFRNTIQHEIKQSLKVPLQTLKTCSNFGLSKQKIVIPTLLKLASATIQKIHAAVQIHYETRSRLFKSSSALRLMNLMRKNSSNLRKLVRRFATLKGSNTISFDTPNCQFFFFALFLPAVHDLFIVLEARNKTLSFFPHHSLIASPKATMQADESHYTQRHVFKTVKIGAKRFIRQRTVYSLKRIELMQNMLKQPLSCRHIASILMIALRSILMRNNIFTQKPILELQFMPRNDNLLIISADLQYCFDNVFKHSILKLKKLCSNEKLVILECLAKGTHSHSTIISREFVVDFSHFAKLKLKHKSIQNIELYPVATHCFTTHSLIDETLAFMQQCSSSKHVVQGDPLSSIVCEAQHVQHDRELQLKLNPLLFIRYIDDILVIVHRNGSLLDQSTAILKLIARTYKNELNNHKVQIAEFNRTSGLFNHNNPLKNWFEFIGSNLQLLTIEKSSVWKVALKPKEKKFN